MEYRGINLELKVPANKVSKLTTLLDSLPLIIEGIDESGLANDNHPITLEVLEDKTFGGVFVLQPTKNSKLICYLDSYSVGRGESECPRISMKPGWSKDLRPFLEVDKNVEGDNYRLNIYPLAKEC